MDARLARAAILAAALASLGASYRTANFVVSAPTPEMAAQIGKQAEDYRRDLAVLWLGSPMRNWGQPCPITAQVGERMGAGGATSFMFDHGEVFGWQMSIQGSLERILDSVLPHEVTHTVFATHFRRPLPRWADEGACTTVEHTSERVKQQQMLITFLKTNRGIPFDSMFAMKEYPRDVLPLYAQGHSLATFLIQQGGRAKYLTFLAAGMQNEQWPSAMKQHYGFASLAQLQNTWVDWVRKGSPALKTPEASPAPEGNTLLASAEPRKRPEPNLIYRGQSGDTKEDVASNLVPVKRRPAAQPGPSELALADARPGPQFSSPAAAAQPLPGPGAPGSSAGALPDRQVLLEWDRNAAQPSPAAGGTSGPSVYMNNRGGSAVGRR